MLPPLSPSPTEIALSSVVLLMVVAMVVGVAWALRVLLVRDRPRRRGDGDSRAPEATHGRADA